MEIIIKGLDKDKKPFEEVWNDVDGYVVIVHQMVPLTNPEGEMAIERVCRPATYSGDLRELVKETRESLIEMEDRLRKRRNGP